MKLLVAGMARSRPATVGKETVASRSMVESSTLVMARVSLPTSVGFAERGEGVGGFAGLRDDHDGGVGEGLLGAVGVFAGVLDVDGDAAEVFDDELGEQAGVAAGAAGGDDDLVVDVLEPLENGGAGVGAELVAIDVSVYRGGEGSGLFEDLAQHPVSEGSGFGWMWAR